MSETENGRLGLYGTEHSKCNHLMTLGFKRLLKTKAQNRPVFL